MKKLSLILAVLLLVPAMAAVNVTVTDNDGTGAGLVGTVNYAADANVSAFALTISVDGGAVITDFTPALVGESKAGTGNQGYGIFPGSIDINDTTGDVNEYGTPVVGTLPASSMIIEMGALYGPGDANRPGLSGTLGTIEVDKACHVSVALEPVRGGIVYTTATAAALGTSGGDIQAQTQVAVPNLVGMNNPGSATALTSVGLVKGTVTYQLDLTMAAGLVKTQNPVAGTMVDPGTAVAVTISCRGDINLDSSHYVNKTDITALINYIANPANGATAPTWRIPAASAPAMNNVNNDTYVNKTDITALINFLAQNGVAPTWRVVCQ